ncbi:MAG: YidC/Oxa1 family membrane protein insertase [Chloroflexota bacterium]
MGDIWLNFILLITQALVALYGVVGSYGIAIILFTVAVRLVFLPLSIKSTRSMRQMQQSQAQIKPHLDALKKKHGNDRQKLMEEQQKLYKEHGVNPMAGLGGCLPMLIQMPLWIALYQALFHLAGTAEFAASFLWIANLAKPEGFPYILALFTGASTWLTQKMMAQPSADQQQKTMNNMMQMMMPLMMIFFAFQVPAGLVLYWATSNIFQFFQQFFITGWGNLRPATVGAPVAALTNGANGSAGNGSAGKNAVAMLNKSGKAEISEPELKEPQTERAAGGNGRWAGARILDQASSVEKNGIRVYTLDPDPKEGGDYTADDSSQNMDESIARAKGQSKPKRKKRKG